MTRVDAAGWIPADWQVPANVHALTTLRTGAGSSMAPFDRCNLGNARAADGDDAATVAANRAALVAAAGLPSVPRWLRQVHGVDVVRFDDPRPVRDGAAAVDSCHPARSEGSAPFQVQTSADSRSLAALGMTDPATQATTDLQTPTVAAASPLDDEPVADASVTGAPGVVLAILTADCLPVVFTARDGREIAAAHAGWRGLADGVLERTVAAMRTSPDDVIAWLGPAAGPQVYEIGDAVRDAFVSHDVRAVSAFVATRPGHWLIDLYALARQRLQDAGVTDVHGGGLCTISDPARFYSYRRDGRTGRMATLVWMEPPASSG